MDKVCVFCRETLIDEAAFCHSCGSPVSSSSTPSPNRPVLEEKLHLKNTLDCYECSMPVALNHNYCVSCGADLQNKPVPKPQPRKTQKPNQQPSADLQLEEFISRQTKNSPHSPPKQPTSYHRSRRHNQPPNAKCRKCGHTDQIKNFYKNASLTPLDMVIFIVAIIGFAIHFIIGLILISASAYVSFKKLFMTCPNCHRITFNPSASIERAIARRK